MTNKTLIPAFKARVGDWNYYMCMMKYAAVAREIGFAHELGANQDLATMLQRGIGERTREITDYLLSSRHRFLGAIIVAAHGGRPHFTEVNLDLTPELAGCDREFGFLTFDGSQQYFALDGQHRLKAIKDAIKQEPLLANEDICVLIVPHFDTREGKEKTRRLFTNINRNAKATTKAENIALDEDDGFAIIARRMVDEHDYLKRKGVVKIYTRQGDDGLLRLAGKQVNKTDEDAFTTLATLYEIIRNLGFDLPVSFHSAELRPTDEELESAYQILAKRIDHLMMACGDVRKLIDSRGARDVRVPAAGEELGHALMRPVVQLAVSETLKVLIQTGRGEYESLLDGLRKFGWEIGSAPWRAVYNPNTKTMITAKENQELLCALLRVHLAPQSKIEVTRTRSLYKNLVSEKYPLSDEELSSGIPE
jgi:DNA sulfur modification protein DndB